MQTPSSTYRVQLHKDFNFKELEGIIDYLQLLGISTVYAAPVLRSRPGSMHGYDVIDPHKIDKEIGTYEDLKHISKLLNEKGMFWIQDIVPNHMAFDVLNQKLMDVLERGPQSSFYNYFDIDWHHPAFKGKIAVPFLGKELQECVADKEIKLSFSSQGFTVDYYDTKYPLSTAAYGFLEGMGEELKGKLAVLSKGAQRYADLTEWKNFKKQWLSECEQDEGLLADVKSACERISNSPDLLLKVLEHQFYMLTYWKLSEKQMNYRRFFTVNELICLRMEDKAVFTEYHQFIHKLYKEKIIQGVRIDHIDGLYDPSEYVKELRNLLGKDCYIIAEKILEAKEDVPEYWPLEGTSGYEFLSFVSQLITDRKGASQLLNFYKELLPELPPYQTMVYENKKLILENYMRGEWDNLIRYFIACGLQDRFEENQLKNALAEFMLALPVYRIYPLKLPLKGEDLKLVSDAIRKAKMADPSCVDELEYLNQLYTSEVADRDKSANALKFLKRLMQFTGPLTAKGVEDTTFYVYNPLISHDEVGDAPSQLGISVEAFHQKMESRQKHTPLSLNATATHDTKRGEDARLRLNILSELPDLWQSNVRAWLAENEKLKSDVSGILAPSVNDEYFIYQSLLGGLPEDLQITDEFIERFHAFLVKAIREAKVNSNWSDPNEAYEEACKKFVADLFSENHTFTKTFIPFAEVVIRYANVYALGQVLIKITTPGIPDIYQGCEFWDLSFVDPDNRRPVDYALRRNCLQEIIGKEDEGRMQLFRFLKSRRNVGYEKMFVTWKALLARGEYADVFTRGEYLPLKISSLETVGVAYARRAGNRWVLVAVPLALAKNRELDQPYASDPEKTFDVLLPPNAPSNWKNIFTGESVQSNGKISFFDLFKDFPVALLVAST